MTKIISSEDCGNSPKNIFVEKMTIALEQGDIDTFLENSSDDICWIRIGETPLQGRDAVKASLEQRNRANLAEIRIQHVVTHGKAGAVNGLTRSIDGTSYAFCYVYEFTNAKGALIKEITPYILQSS